MELVSSDNKVLFATGRLLVTNGALEATKKVGQGLEPLIDRHMAGDWGDLEREDKVQNDEALKLGNRVLSSYNLSDGVKVWIITEWDRSATTILLPSDY